MADPRFFAVRGPFTLAELAARTGASLAAGADPGATIVDVAALDTAGPSDLSFLDNRRYVEAFKASRAGACLVAPALAAMAPEGMALLITDKPYHAYARAAQAFYPEAPVPSGRHARAAIDAAARLADDVVVEAGAVIGARAEIGARTRIGANTVVGPGVMIGADCLIGANVTLSHCLIGNAVRLLPGVRIGQDGFGYAMGAEGHLKVPQLGRVIIGDAVEIGANTCVDRGTAGDTVIGAGSCIDNLVQIGHNVKLGRGCVVVAQVGISGSTRLDDLVVIGGQAGIAGHLHVGAGALIAARSAVVKDIPAGQKVGGEPAVPVAEFYRRVAMLRRMGRRKGDENEQRD
jgi:UDP-3-O-[3-hydroxymyristoyl] glucosamine N-acyltransferase